MNNIDSSFVVLVECGQLLGALEINLGVEDAIPEFVGDAVSDTAELVVVLHVVDLEVAEVLVQHLTVVQVIVDHVVSHVTDPEAGHEGTEVRIGAPQTDERMNHNAVENIARDRRENKAKTVAGESVMDTVDHEVASEDPLVSRHVPHPVVLAVEKEPMKNVLGECPEEEACDGGDDVDSEASGSQVELVVNVGTPEHRDHPPVGLGGELENRVVEQQDVAHGVRQNLGLVDVLDIFFEGPLGVPDLPEERLVVIKYILGLELLAEQVGDTVLRSSALAVLTVGVGLHNADNGQLE